MTLGTRAVSFEQKPKFPKAEGYNIKVGPTWFRTVANKQVPVQIGSRDSLAPRQDQRGSIYQNVLDIGYAWGRTDLSGGEGLDWDPREISLERDETSLDLIRFWDSVGINTARNETQGEQYTLELARAFEDWDGTVTDPRDIATSEEFIFIADGAVVSWYSSWSVADLEGTDTLPAPVRALAASPNGTVVATMEDGNAVAMRLAAGEVVFTAAYGDGGATKLEAQGVWYVNGRFILSTFDAVDVAELRSLDYVSASWADASIDAATGPFWSVVESGPAIVAACADGTVRSYTPTADDVDLTLLPRSRTTMPDGESPILLGSNASILLIMTTADHPDTNRQELRLYQAEVLDARFNFVVGQLQLKREWRASEHEGLVTRNMTNTREEIFFFVKEEGQGQLATDESLWRFDVVTAGLTRVSFTAGVNLNGLVVFDQFFGGIDFQAPKLLISDPDIHVTEGRMIFPNITFGLNTPITWIATVIEAHDLTTQGGQIELYYSTDPTAILDTDDPTWVLAQRLSSQGSSNLEVPFVNLKSRTLALQLRIKATNSLSVSPKVTRIALRGIPAHRDLVMMVPFNISDYVSVPGRKPLTIPGFGYSLHEQVLSLVGSSVEAIVIDPPMGFRGVINNVSEPIEYLSSRGSVTRYVMVEFRGQRLTQTVSPTGDAGIGLGLMGIAIMGIGQSEDT